MNYTGWENQLDENIKSDVLWKMEVYRLSLFSADIGWFDVTKLAKDTRTQKLSDQLYRALGSISANIAEGYSRSSGRDQARFYEYALGSARESRDWYFKSRHVLGNTVIEHRIELLTEIIRLLLKIIQNTRKNYLKESQSAYEVSAQPNNSENDITSLLQDIPY